MLSFVRRELSCEIVYLLYVCGFGAVVVGLGAFVFVRAVTFRPAIAPHVAKVHTVALSEGSEQSMARDADVARFEPQSSSDSPSGPSQRDLWFQAKLEPTPAPAPVPTDTLPKPENRPTARTTTDLGDVAPSPPARPAGIALPGNPPVPVPRRTSGPALAYSVPDRNVFGEPRSNAFDPTTRYDQWTAVYDLTAHTVYLPNGSRLEAHSGLGDKLDDPRFVSERDRGATPPHLYELTQREELFHGVQALRLNPVGGDIFGRTGLLAHTYMLGPRGDSNGCVSFKDYDAFLQAFKNGVVKRLAVVSQLN
jgi:hypothetical protein